MQAILKTAHAICNGNADQEEATREALQAFFTAHPCVQDVAFRHFIKPLVEEMARRYWDERFDGRNARAYRMAAEMTRNAKQ